MITLLSFVVSPIGRWVALAVILSGLAVAAVVKVRHDAIQAATQQATQDALERLQDAIRRGNAVDNSPDKLRQPDPNCRDC